MSRHHVHYDRQQLIRINRPGHVFIESDQPGSAQQTAARYSVRTTTRGAGASRAFAGLH